jgi:acyl-CoA reductase-like NAD-dependent aldehyde dehydrogenase
MTKVISVLDPRTGDNVAQVEVAKPAECDEAIKRAAEAADFWARAPGGASEPRRASGTGFGFGPELLDEMTAMKVVHLSPPAS